MPQVQHPANGITFVRALLAVVVAVIGPTGPGLVLVVVALALDWVDGQVARRTGTASAFGARFDMETDAFLILVLSVYVAADVGWWVLLIGAARYLLWLAERVLPWLRRPVPPRYWRKVVAAVQGIVLAVAVSGLLPTAAAEALLVGRARAARRVVRPRRVVAVAHPHRGGAVPERRRPHAARARCGLGRAGAAAATRATWCGCRSRRCCSSRSRCSPGGGPGVGGRWCSASRSGRSWCCEVFDVGLRSGPGPALRPDRRLGLPRPGRRRARRLDRRPRRPARPRSRPSCWSPRSSCVLPLATVRVAGHDRPAPTRRRRPERRPRPRGARPGRLHQRRRVLAYDEVVQVRADLADRQTFAREIAADRYATVPGAPAAARPARQGRAPGVRRVATAGSPCRARRSRAGVDAVLDDGPAG